MCFGRRVLSSGHLRQVDTSEPGLRRVAAEGFDCFRHEDKKFEDATLDSVNLGYWAPSKPFVRGGCSMKTGMDFTKGSKSVLASALSGNPMPTLLRTGWKGVPQRTSPPWMLTPTSRSGSEARSQVSLIVGGFEI